MPRGPGSACLLAFAGYLAAACSDTSAASRDGAIAGMNASGGKPAEGGESGGDGGRGGQAVAGAPASAGQPMAGHPDAGGAAVAGTSGRGGASGSGGAALGGGGPGPTCASEPSGAPTDLAFPGAQGFGRHATGGREGTVYHVTNLNDSGAGSFRDAVSRGQRIVVFDVGGYISLKTAVAVQSDITIAGQSAPGGGIGFKGGEISFANRSNIIFRHVRVRPGSDTESDTDDALSLYRASNVILDHSSFEFAPWNNIGGVSDDWQNRPATDITFQDSLIADPIGQQFGAHCESVESDWAWYGNVFANSHNRNPLSKVNTVFVNNVLYNYSAGYTTHTSTSFEHDIVANYFVFGPASKGTDNTWFQVDKNQSIYASGNLKDNDLDGQLNGAETTPYWYQGTGKVLDAAWSTVAAATYDAASAFRVAVSRAGVLPRDPLDALIISQVQTLGKGTTGTGVGTTGPSGALYTSQTQTGLENDGYGEIAGGTKPADADDDGMPDFWEAAMGTNPAADDAMQKAADGYARIEQYLNWLAEPHALTSAGKSVEIDLGALAAGFADVAPTFSATEPACGTVEIDGSSARFTPSAGFRGLSSFDFRAKGSDGTTLTGRVGVLVQP